MPVELELVLAVDASGSVDQGEYRLQMQGLAAAFRDPEVLAAIEASGPGGIAVALMQWSGLRQQTLVAGWRRIADKAAAARFAAQIETAPRTMLGETAIGAALAAAMGMFHGNGFDGRRQVIDLSGDGPNNAGREPAGVRDAAVALGITINGLVIQNEHPHLGRYYEEHVVGGTGAFVIAARDYHDFAEAIRLKLIQEIRGAPVAQAPGRGLHGRVLVLPPASVIIVANASRPGACGRSRPT